MAEHQLNENMKQFFFGILICIAIYFFTESFLKRNYKAEVWATLFVGVAVVVITLQQYSIAKDEIETKLFLEFNKRYSLINQSLKKCHNKRLSDLTILSSTDSDKDLFNVVEDYVNICCEEFYCYKVKGQISYQVWKYWNEGILEQCRQAPCIKEFWENEYNQSNSFYIIDGEHPFIKTENKHTWISKIPFLKGIMFL